MQMHALARLLVEDRRKVAGGMALVGRDRVEQHLHLDQLVRIESVNPAWPPRRLRRQERLQAGAPLDEAFAHPGYDDVPPHLLLDRTGFAPAARMAGMSLSGFNRSYTPTS